MLTNRDWGDEDDDDYTSLVGQALSNYGALWTEAYSSIEETTSALAHEIGHLFKAGHVYRKDAVMHPLNEEDNFLWTSKTKETILKNKFRNWEEL